MSEVPLKSVRACQPGMLRPSRWLVADYRGRGTSLIRNIPPPSRAAIGP